MRNRAPELAALALLAAVGCTRGSGPAEPVAAPEGQSERVEQLRDDLREIEGELAAALRSGQIRLTEEQCRSGMLAAAEDLVGCGSDCDLVGIAEGLVGQAAPGVE